MAADNETLIREAITETFGERCPDFDPDCHCCKAWAELDALLASQDEADARVRKAVEDEREKTRKMHRRAQQVESPWQSERDVALAMKEFGWDYARSSSERASNTWQVAKRIYEACAPILGLYYGIYHSINDMPFQTPPEGWRTKDQEPKGTIWVNVFHSKFGGASTYSLTEVVERVAAIRSQGGAE